MSLRRLAAAWAAAVLLPAAGLGFATPASAATAGPNCYGSVGCAGTAVTSACDADKVKMEQDTVPNLGQLTLYVSPVCGTAWAQLIIDVTAPVGSTSYADHGYTEGYRYVAEIFYEPPTGGAEQFILSSPWLDGTSPAASTLITPMLPSNASFKACGGAPSDAANAVAVPFDEDPQGGGGLAEPQLYPGLSSTPTPAPGGPPTDYNAGACTLWH